MHTSQTQLIGKTLLVNEGQTVFNLYLTTILTM